MKLICLLLTELLCCFQRSWTQNSQKKTRASTLTFHTGHTLRWVIIQLPPHKSIYSRKMKISSLKKMTNIFFFNLCLFMSALFIFLSLSFVCSLRTSTMHLRCRYTRTLERRCCSMLLKATTCAYLHTDRREQERATPWWDDRKKTSRGLYLW